MPIPLHTSMKMAATLQPLLAFKKPEADNVQPEIDPNPNPNPSPSPSPNPNPNPNPNPLTLTP